MSRDFNSCWPEINKHGIDNGWLGIAKAAWDIQQQEIDLLKLTLAQVQEREKQALEYIERLEAAARQAGEVVGKAGAMPGTSGFTMACFEASKVPLGTDLYTSPATDDAKASENQNGFTVEAEQEEEAFWDDAAEMAKHDEQADHQRVVKVPELPPLPWQAEAYAGNLKVWLELHDGESLAEAFKDYGQACIAAVLRMNGGE